MTRENQLGQQLVMRGVMNERLDEKDYASNLHVEVGSEICFCLVRKPPRLLLFDVIGTLPHRRMCEKIHRSATLERQRRNGHERVAPTAASSASDRSKAKGMVSTRRPRASPRRIRCCWPANPSSCAAGWSLRWSLHYQRLKCRSCFIERFLLRPRR
ncbi:hypothetical protein BT69DRAFT_297188 [Atractiella rhizophila]|nr:hypothetical protein BT69DRAFT_297188 [Atractiella rhizophila]